MTITAAAAAAAKPEDSAPIQSADPSAGPCPPWCEIDDHDDWDKGKMQHSSWVDVGLWSYPYEVTTTESGAPVTTLACSSLMVSRCQVRDHEPAIVITLPDSIDGECSDPDGHVILPDSQALLNFAEAQETAVALLVMTGRGDGSLHFACTPGDPSPCCPDSLLGASAYQAAVFCPNCGSLYWRADTPR